MITTTTIPKAVSLETEKCKEEIKKKEGDEE
jgi:hypothetical protein